MNELCAITPIDGRYAEKVENVSWLFSEHALIKYRFRIMVRWVLEICQLNGFPIISRKHQGVLNSFVSSFCKSDSEHIKEIEKTTNHDVKAVEYYLKKLIRDAEIPNISEFVHFGCTSEDVNNLAYALMLKDAVQHLLASKMSSIVTSLNNFADENKGVSMLARTHGQPATPTTLRKEMRVFVRRLLEQAKQLDGVIIYGKLNGASGNYNALMVAYPNIDWEYVSRRFVRNLGLTFNPITTQIEPHDYIAELCHMVIRFNNILLDLCRDMWGYISFDYLVQQKVETEVGSSTMPHKVNPIDFENAEGNIGLSNTVLEHLANKLPISRFQRDLSDSTALRSLGVGFAYAAIAYQSFSKGLSKVQPNHKQIAKDLNNHWEVLAEPIQMVMRKHMIDNSYEQLKTLTRGQKITKHTVRKFISNLDITSDDKDRLLALTPETYIGLADEI